MQESLGRGFSRFLRNPRFGSALRLLLYHAERKGRKGSSIRESLSEITPADRKIRHDPWPKWAATLRACIPRSISKGKAAQGGTETERKDATGRNPDPRQSAPARPSASKLRQSSVPISRE